MHNPRLVPIVFSFDDAMRYPALVCIDSLLRAAQPSTYYDIFILYVTHRLSEPNRHLFQQFVADRYGHQARLTLIAVPPDIEEILTEQFKQNHGYVNPEQTISVDTYCRLMIPQLVTRHDIIIYSDIDIIFRSDLSELLSVDIEQSSLGACRDYYVTRTCKITPSQAPVQPERYFNAGFLLFNAKRIRQQNTMELPTLITHMKKNYRLADQDTLNVLFGDDYIALSPRYNYCIPTAHIYTTEYAYVHAQRQRDARRRARRIRPIVYHYPGLSKPWNNMPTFGWLWIRALLKTKAPPSSTARAFRHWKYQTLLIVLSAAVFRITGTIITIVSRTAGAILMAPLTISIRMARKVAPYLSPTLRRRIRAALDTIRGQHNASDA